MVVAALQARVAAAVTIQSRARGWIIRKRIKAKKRALQKGTDPSTLQEGTDLSPADVAQDASNTVAMVDPDSAYVPCMQ